MANKFSAFIIGGLVGAVAGLLYAPRTGAEMRAMVADKANQAWGEAQEWTTQAANGAQEAVQQATDRGQQVASDLQNNVQQAVNAVAEKGQSVYQTAQAKMQEAAGNVKPVFTEKNDELRDKIEAARQRIAAQVARNAQETSSAADDQIPVVAAEAKDAVDTAAQAVTDTVNNVAGAVEDAASQAE